MPVSGAQTAGKVGDPGSVQHQGEHQDRDLSIKLSPFRHLVKSKPGGEKTYLLVERAHLMEICPSQFQLRVNKTQAVITCVPSHEFRVEFTPSAWPGELQPSNSSIFNSVTCFPVPGRIFSGGQPPPRPLKSQDQPQISSQLKKKKKTQNQKKAIYHK